MHVWIEAARPLRALGVIGLTVGLNSLSPALRAQVVPTPDPSGYTQCSTHAINDSGMAVGGCVPADPAAPHAATYAPTAGSPPAILIPLVTGQDCNAGRIANNGTVIGDCVQAKNIGRAVVWGNPTRAPLALAPLPFLSGLNLEPDVSSGVSAFNQTADVAGESIYW